MILLYLRWASKTELANILILRWVTHIIAFVRLKQKHPPRDSPHSSAGLYETPIRSLTACLLHFENRITLCTPPFLMHKTVLTPPISSCWIFCMHHTFPLFAVLDPHTPFHLSLIISSIDFHSPLYVFARKILHPYATVP